MPKRTDKERNDYLQFAKALRAMDNKNMHKRTYQEGKDYLQQAKEFARALLAETSTKTTKDEWYDGGFNIQLAERAVKTIDVIDRLQFVLSQIERQIEADEDTNNELPF